MIALFSPRRIRAGFVIFLLMLGTLLWAAPKAGLAQDGTLEWSRPIPLSGALGGSRYPSVVANDDGQVLLLWGVAGVNEGATLFVSRFDGQLWQRPVDVLLGGPQSRAQLDGRDRVHLLYPRGSEQILSDVEFQAADSARGWGGTMTVNSSPDGVGADFIFSDDGGLYTTWMQRLPGCDTCFSIGYKKYATDVSSELTYRVLADLVNSPEQRTQLRRASDGTLYVMWDAAPRDGLDAGIVLSISEDDGDTWLEEARHFASPDAAMRQPLLFVDSAENLILVYNFGVRDETYFSVSTDQGETWTGAAPVPGLFANKLADASDYFAHITDTAGVTHLIASGRASPGQQSPGLYHLTWDGTAWGNFQELYNEGSVPEFPAVALANGNRLHVSFATRDTSPVSGNVLSSYQVWYTSALTNAPAATRVPLPTFTPVPTLTPTPETTGTPTPRPSSTPLPPSAAANNQPSVDIGPILPVLIVVVPVALILVGVIVWVNVFRRRI